MDQQTHLNISTRLTPPYGPYYILQSSFKKSLTEAKHTAFTRKTKGTTQQKPYKGFNIKHKGYQNQREQKDDASYQR